MGLLADLVRANIDPELIERVAQEIADARAGRRSRETPEERREKDRLRKRAARLSAQSADSPSDASACPQECADTADGSRARDTEDNPGDSSLSPYQKGPLKGAQKGNGPSQPLAASDSPSPVGADGDCDMLGDPVRKIPRQKPTDEPIIEEIAGIWNQTAASLGLPQIQGLTERRERMVRARLRDFEVYRYDDPIAGTHALMARIRGSPFLQGSNGWRATFDFVFKPDNFAKIMEGQYEKDRKPNGRYHA